MMQTATIAMQSGGGGVSFPLAAGSKRRRDESSLAGDSERFTKRFNLLNLGASVEPHGSSNYYIPVSKPISQATAPTTTSANVNVKDNGKTTEDELMQVDDTPNRVYIHNLDDELADIESEDEKLIFLPDIEKRLSKIPKHVLTGRREDDHEGQELVLYSVPKSLTADEGHDAVRKAILETRHRAREKAVEEARQLDMNCKYGQSSNVETAETAHGYSTGYVEELDDPDPDAMDMD